MSPNNPPQQNSPQPAITVPKESVASEIKKPVPAEDNLHVQHYLQSAGLCGPASLRILLSYFGKNFSEAELAQLGVATIDQGTEHEGMITAIKAIDGYVFVKNEGTLDEIEYFVRKEKLPVIIGWFDESGEVWGDHYSVVVNVTEKNVIMVDPSKDEAERWIDRKNFQQIWFDFIGKENKIVSWGWYMVVTFEKRKFDIKGGHYY